MDIARLAVTHDESFQPITVTLAGYVLEDANIAPPQAQTLINHQLLVGIETLLDLLPQVVAHRSYSFHGVFIRLRLVLVAGVGKQAVDEVQVAEDCLEPVAPHDTIEAWGGGERVCGPVLVDGVFFIVPIRMTMARKTYSSSGVTGAKPL